MIDLDVGIYHRVRHVHLRRSWGWRPRPTRGTG